MKDTISGNRQPSGILPAAPRISPVYFHIALFSLAASVAVLTSFKAQSLIGAFLVTFLLLTVFYRDIARYKPKFFMAGKNLLLLGLLVVATLLFSRLAGYLLYGMSKGFRLPSGSVVYAIPVASGAMLTMLLFDSHTAIMFSFIVSLLAGLWLRDASYPVFAFIGSLTAAFSVIRCKKRTEIVKGGGFLLAANVITVLVLMLLAGRFFTLKTWYSVVFAAVGAVAVTAAVSLALPVLEYIFGVTTDISLLELLNLDHPLMKTMMITAPGTYHHSIIVGNLVEAAAEDAGVNPLLARVSAYYHDIGKIKMPDYFVENQAGGVSKHERLTPHMSSMVLISHVKEGTELARQYKLPEAVIDVIQQHHGNSLINYFYQKAKEKADDLNEEEYKYPGPAPQSKAAALVMMADAVEAASRVLSDPTPARISNLVNRIINHIFLEGQLDNCELTLKDIQKIKQRFIYILNGILHKRIDYPGFDFDREGGVEDAGPDNQLPEMDAAGRQTDKEGLSKAARLLRFPKS